MNYLYDDDNVDINDNVDIDDDDDEIPIHIKQQQIIFLGMLTHILN